MTVRIFGIKNCNTMKKAFEWLDAHQVEYEFHDYKKFGIGADQLQAWAVKTGWQKLLNIQGTTWRGMSEAERANVDEAKAISLMHNKTSLIKRPVIEAGKDLLVGFDETIYTKKLTKSVGA